MVVVVKCVPYRIGLKIINKKFAHMLILQKKLEEFEKEGFTVQEGEKSIHSAESVRFMLEVIKAGKWQLDVLENGLILDLKEIPSK